MFKYRDLLAGVETLCYSNVMDMLYFKDRIVSEWVKIWGIQPILNLF